MDGCIRTSKWGPIVLISLGTLLLASCMASETQEPGSAGGMDAVETADAAPEAARWDGVFLLEPDRIGPLTAETSRAALVSAVGREAVADESLYMGEGMCSPGSVLFPGSLNEVEILWADSAGSRPAEVRIRTHGSDWHTRRGLTVGTSLKDLEQWADDAVTFAGFGWDYAGGGVWSEEEGDYRIRLLPGGGEMEKVNGEPGLGAILGDQTVRSDHPLIRRMTVRVAEVSWVWGYPDSVTDCG